MTSFIRPYFLMFAVLVCCGVLACFPVPTSAQQPIATISSLQGTVQVSIQGQDALPATVGLGLQSGDTVETLAEASITLTLSEGSELNFGENTKVDIAVLSQRPETKARTSLLRLLSGKVRALLSPGHQKEGSAFTVETPNAIAGVKFSRPEIMVSYDPATETTIIEAYTVDMVVRNLITQEVKDVPKGNRGIVRKERTIISPLAQREVPDTVSDTDETTEEEMPTEEIPQTPVEEVVPATSETPETEISSNSLLFTRNAIRQSTCPTAPSSIGSIGTGDTAGTTVTQSESGNGTASVDDVGGGAETSSNPSPGVRPSRPDRQARVIQIHIEN